VGLRRKVGGDDGLSDGKGNRDMGGGAPALGWWGWV
jgi:hypothetical protein